MTKKLFISFICIFLFSCGLYYGKIKIKDDKFVGRKIFKMPLLHRGKRCALVAKYVKTIKNNKVNNIKIEIFTKLFVFTKGDKFSDEAYFKFDGKLDKKKVANINTNIEIDKDKDGKVKDEDLNISGDIHVSINFLKKIINTQKVEFKIDFGDHSCIFEYTQFDKDKLKEFIDAK